MTLSGPITVLAADDHPLVREGIGAGAIRRRVDGRLGSSSAIA